MDQTTDQIQAPIWQHNVDGTREVAVLYSIYAYINAVLASFDLVSWEDAITDPVPRCRCQQGEKTWESFPVSGQTKVSMTIDTTCKGGVSFTMKHHLCRSQWSGCVFITCRKQSSFAFVLISCVCRSVLQEHFVSLHIIGPQGLHLGTS